MWTCQICKKTNDDDKMCPCYLTALEKVIEIQKKKEKSSAPTHPS